jgi:hypothetical protein
MRRLLLVLAVAGFPLAGSVGQQVDPAEKEFEDLALKNIEGKDPADRAGALDILGRLKMPSERSKQVVRTITRMLSFDNNKDVQKWVRPALQNIDPDLGNAIKTLEESRVPEDRAKALQKLTALNSQRLEKDKEKEQEQAELVSKILERIRQVEKSDPIEAENLRAALRKASEKDVSGAKAAIPVLLQLMQRPDPDEQVQLAAALASIGVADGEARLAMDRLLASSDTDPKVRASVKAALDKAQNDLKK